MKKISAEHAIYNFSQDNVPIMEVNAGEMLVFETADCFSGQVRSEHDILADIDKDKLNPATGPVFVRGAKPGDLLEVQIQSIRVANVGVSAVVPGEGVLGDSVRDALVRIIPIEDKKARYLDLQIPITPMIGVIGVASSDKKRWPTSTPWRHGGNMDTKDIREGTTLYLPVDVEGALLAMGDLHALMADGEVSFTGLEVAGEVDVRVRVIAGKTLAWPVLETDDEIMIIASGDSVEDATKAAFSEAVEILKETLACRFEEAYLLSSLVVDARISQLVDPKVTVRAVIPKSILKANDLFATFSEKT